MRNQQKNNLPLSLPPSLLVLFTGMGMGLSFSPEDSGKGCTFHMILSPDKDRTCVLEL